MNNDPNIPPSDMNAIKTKDYCDEYLKRHDDPVAHASKLFSAGKAETILDTAYTDFTFPRLIWFLILFPFAIWGEIEGKKANPHKPLFKYACDGRNKLIVFRDWLVRCTYQQYDHQKQAELFYYTGIPLKHIESVSIGDLILIYGDGCNLGGAGMKVHKKDKAAIAAVFHELKLQGRLHPEVKITVD